MKADITVILVAYNGYGKYLPERMEEIRNQTIQPAEVIVVLGPNHGVEDDLGTTTVPTDTIQGLGTMFNIGIEKAKTKWVLCMDIDDNLLPFAIEEVKKFQHTGNIISLGWVLTDGGSGKWIHRVEEENLVEWKNHYLGRSGALAFEKTLIGPDNCWQYQFIMDAFPKGKCVVRTDRACTKYHRFENTMSSQKGIADIHIKIIEKAVEKCQRELSKLKGKV